MLEVWKSVLLVALQTSFQYLPSTTKLLQIERFIFCHIFFKSFRMFFFSSLPTFIDA